MRLLQPLAALQATYNVYRARYLPSCGENRTPPDTFTQLETQTQAMFVDFPRVTFGPIPLSPDKTELFMSEVEAVGFHLADGKILPAAQHRTKFERWRDLDQAASSNVDRTSAAPVICLTPFLWKHILGRADLVRTLKTGVFEVVGTTRPQVAISR
jgi:hypothetical protein